MDVSHRDVKTYRFKNRGDDVTGSIKKRDIRDPRSKKRDRLFRDGEWLVKGNIQIIRMIGEGGFGQIYEAEDKKGVRMAVKTGPRNHKSAPRMVLEQFLLQKISRYEFFPDFYRSGSTDTVNYICMELLGPNVHDLKKKRDSGHFSTATSFGVAHQMVYALEAVHYVGYLHRDVKPSNMCLRTENSRVVLLVDFGLARRYLDQRGVLRRFRSYAGFRGTGRYASWRVHDHQEHTVVDDFWSLVYSTIEMAMGDLPWRKVQDPKHLIKAKRQFVPKMRRYTSRMTYLFSYLNSCEPHYRIDYSKVKKALKLPDDEADEPYDWEAEEIYTESSDYNESTRATASESVESEESEAGEKVVLLEE
ncbi:unnamed protein product [Bursaphelenchus okinawaensis]|uniref:non-specific serine/threonine protein kinase n=1 Tax=Bursaphelenchus okinawaensis TaxID=465554 RepID=A0A811KEL6_9BILA|nr:unnamed protein product [Bursaphelenchus okinawaensis]CAG9101798.1 unnamed protein product [Bursaphelenchus okinawaensis]